MRPGFAAQTTSGSIASDIRVYSCFRSSIVAVFHPLGHLALGGLFLIVCRQLLLREVEKNPALLVLAKTKRTYIHVAGLWDGQMTCGWNLILVGG